MRSRISSLEAPQILVSKSDALPSLRTTAPSHLMILNQHEAARFCSDPQRINDYHRAPGSRSLALPSAPPGDRRRLDW